MGYFSPTGDLFNSWVLIVGVRIRKLKEGGVSFSMFLLFKIRSFNVQTGKKWTASSRNLKQQSQPETQAEMKFFAWPKNESKIFNSLKKIQKKGYRSMLAKT